jgi:hypothetical protein
MLEETLSNPTYSPAEVAQILTSYVEVELPAGGAAAEARFFQLFSLLCQRVFGVISTKDYIHENGGWLARTKRWERPLVYSSKSPSTGRHIGPIKSSQQTSVRTDPVIGLLGTGATVAATTTESSKDQPPMSLIEAFAKEAEHRDNVRYEFPFLGLPKSMQEDWLALIQTSLGAVALDNHRPSENSKCLLGTLFRVKPLAQNQLRLYQQMKVQKKDQRRPLQLNPMYASPTPTSPSTPKAGTTGSPNEDKQDVAPNVLFSMLEYYLLVFIRYPLAAPDIKAATATSSTPANRVGSLSRSPYLSSRSSEPYGEYVYYELFTEYTYYYVPARGSRGPFNGFVGLQRPSELFVRIVIAIWLEGLNQLAATVKAVSAFQERRGINVSLDLNASFDLVKATYRSPPKQVTRCLHNLVMRIVADGSVADLAEHVHRDLKGRNLDFMCLSPTMKMMQQPFYNHIRNVFRHASIHSKDSTFYTTLSDWLAWLEPWNTQYHSSKQMMRNTVARSSNDKPGQDQARYVVPKTNQRSRFSPEWEAYIASNLHFYTIPFALFLRRARELDFSTTLYQKSLDTVMRVLRVYTKDVVAVIDRLLAESRTGTILPMQSPSSSKVQYIEMVKMHEKNLGEFAPPEVSLSLTSLREDMHSLLEEIHLQHLKNKEKLDFVDRAIAAIEGAFGSGTYKNDERDLHVLTQKAKAIFNFPPDYEVIPQRNKTRATDLSKKDDSCDRTSEGFFSGSGLARVTEGQIKCRPEEVVYVGDSMYCRPQSYELAFLVPILIRLSESLNNRFGLDHSKGKASDLPNFVPKRFNLRFVADYRNIIFAALVLWLFRLRMG